MSRPTYISNVSMYRPHSRPKDDYIRPVGQTKLENACVLQPLRRTITLIKDVLGFVMTESQLLQVADHCDIGVYDLYDETFAHPYDFLFHMEAKGQRILAAKKTFTERAVRYPDEFCHLSDQWWDRLEEISLEHPLSEDDIQYLLDEKPFCLEYDD